MFNPWDGHGRGVAEPGLLLAALDGACQLAKNICNCKKGRHLWQMANSVTGI